MANKTWPFTIPANYIYDPVRIEISGGLAQLKRDIGLEAYGHWHLNESSGAIAADSSGNDRHGSLVNMEDEDWKAGKLNNCLEFDGGDEVVNLGDIANFERTDPFSIELWFNTGDYNHDIINRMMAVAPYTGWGLWMKPGGGIQFFFVNSTGLNNLVSISVSGNYADSVWYHIVITHDGTGTAAGFHIYIDGQDKILAIEKDNLSNSTQNAVDCRIGARDRAAYHYDGLIDEVLIYEKELSQAEVDLRWNSGAGSEGMSTGDYPTDKPTIRPSSSWRSFGMTELTAFLTILGSGNQGSVGYQLSEDDGVTWLYWNGATWSEAGENDYNDAATIQVNAGSFPINEDKIVFKAFLISDGSQKVELNSIEITAEKILDFLQATDRKITDIRNVEIGEWKIVNHVLYFLDPTGQETIASFQLHYDTKGNVVRRERIS